jgi:hypothetical protein
MEMFERAICAEKYNWSQFTIFFFGLNKIRSFSYRAASNAMQTGWRLSPLLNAPAGFHITMRVYCSSK